MTGFGVLALLLTSLGTYGVLSSTVAQRRQEIGIRMALGATLGEVRNMVLRQGMKMVLLGVAIGGLACGLITIGGLSLGLLFALGGAAIGFGVSVGGFAAGSVAFGGAAFGLSYALGGAAFGPSTIDGRHCDPAAVEFFRHWVSSSVLPPRCR